MGIHLKVENVANPFGLTAIPLELQEMGSSVEILNESNIMLADFTTLTHP